MILIRSLENRGALLNGTTRKINIEKGGLLNFFAPLTKVALPLIKNVLISLAKSVLVPLGLTKAALAADAAIQKKIWFTNNTSIFKWRNRLYYQNNLFTQRRWFV